MTNFPEVIRKLIAGFERLPGIGPKGATRLVFYLINAPETVSANLADLLFKLKKEVKICSQCFGVSDSQLCPICADPKRKQNIICVVERSIDVMAMESVGGFEGVYHVLGGAINPLDHVGPEDLKIEELIERVRKLGNGAKGEVILATNPTMEGEATALYIKRRIKEAGLEVKVSQIGKGLPMGASLEFADQATLSRALEGRRLI